VYGVARGVAPKRGSCTKSCRNGSLFFSPCPAIMGRAPFPVRVATGEASQFPLSRAWSQNRALGGPQPGLLARNHVNTNSVSYFQQKKRERKDRLFFLHALWPLTKVPKSDPSTYEAAGLGGEKGGAQFRDEVRQLRKQAFFHVRFVDRCPFLIENMVDNRSGQLGKGDIVYI
jgi:hypothetical protein